LNRNEYFSMAAQRVQFSQYGNAVEVGRITWPQMGGFIRESGQRRLSKRRATVMLISAAQCEITALRGGRWYGATTKSTATNSTHQRASTNPPLLSNFASFRRENLSRRPPGDRKLRRVGGNNSGREFHA
jgi:hypothetical protein